MQINDIRVSYKLWGTILGLLLVLPTLASLTLWRFAHVVDSANQQIAHAEQTITDAVLWRGIVDANIERTLAAILVADDATAQLFRSRPPQRPVGRGRWLCAAVYHWCADDLGAGAHH